MLISDLKPGMLLVCTSEMFYSYASHVKHASRGYNRGECYYDDNVLMIINILPADHEYHSNSFNLICLNKDGIEVERYIVDDDFLEMHHKSDSFDNSFKVITFHENYDK